MYKKASDQASKQVADKADKWNNIGSLRPIHSATTKADTHTDKYTDHTLRPQTQHTNQHGHTNK